MIRGHEHPRKRLPDPEAMVVDKETPRNYNSYVK